MRYLIGIDGGGSHTEAILCSEDGAVVATVRGGPCSTSGSTLDEAVATVKGIVDQLLFALPAGATVAQLYAGISGCGIEKDRIRYLAALKDSLPVGEIDIGSDVFNLAYAACVHQNAVVAIAGTGSIAYAVTPKGIFRVDGYGCLLGDDGGGYAIGREVVRAALRFEDGRGAPTALVALLSERTGRTAQESSTDISAGGRASIASFAPLAFEAAARGDAVAGEILDRAAAELAAMIAAAARRVSASPVPVVTGGKIFEAHEGVLLAKTKALLGDGYQFIASDLPLVYGAVMHAAMLAGIKKFKVIEENKNEIHKHTRN